jgi:hypothetical protein
MRTHLSLVILGTVGAVALALCLRMPAAAGPQSSASVGPAPATALTIETLPSPARAGSSEPQMTVQGDRLILSWLEVTGDRATLKFSERTATGWSDPKVVYTSEDFFVNSFDVPSVRALADGTLAAHWLEKNGPDPDASQVRLTWSKDQGRTWLRPTSPHHDGTKTEHGFVSLFQSPNAGLGVVWIDGRATDPEKETGDMSLRAALYDANGKQLSETVVNPRVCECCSTAATPTPEGVAVAYRNRNADEVRDIYVSRFVGGHWAPPTDVHKDGWKLDACPINGPAINAQGNNVAVAWFMAKNDRGQALVAFSHDAGASFSPPVRVDDAGSLGRMGVAMLADGSAAVTWIESSKPRSQLRLRIVKASGERSAPVTISDAAGGERYPRIAHAGNELLLSWTEGNDKSSQVRTARLTIGGK